MSTTRRSLSLHAVGDAGVYHAAAPLLHDEERALRVSAMFLYAFYWSKTVLDELAAWQPATPSLELFAYKSRDLHRLEELSDRPSHDVELLHKHVSIALYTHMLRAYWRFHRSRFALRLGRKCLAADASADQVRDDCVRMLRLLARVDRLNRGELRLALPHGLPTIEAVVAILSRM
jgi:hypothetical protein